jgi:hypothetical protein
LLAGPVGSPRHGFDSGEQFHQLHGFDQVVISAGSEAQHYAAFVVAGSQDEDGDLGYLS